MKNKAFGIAAAFFSACALGAQSHISTQAHQSPVTALAAPGSMANADTSVFSSGADGFLVKWTDDGLGEHYQLTELAIKMIARSPNGNDIAVYETDGATINRVTIWNWRTLTRKYSFRFSNPLTSLAFSAKGTFVLCGTAAVNGLVFLNAANGNIVTSKIKEETGTVSLAHTSKTENTAVLYSPAGSLTYYNLKTGARKARFAAERNLTQVCLFNNEVFVAGTKGNSIYVLQATTGQTIAQYGAQNPILIGSNDRSDLLYLVQENRTFTLHAIANDRNKAVVRPQTLGTFAGLKQDETLTGAAVAGGIIYAGTSLGNVYKCGIPESPAHETIYPITDNMYDYISDVASVGEDFYFLTPHAIFRSSYDNGIVDRKGANPGHTNLLTYGTGVILWSKETKKPVQLLDLATGTLTALFTPQLNIQTLRRFDDTLIFIEGNATVNSYDIVQKKREQLYLGASLQDALQTSPNDLYVAKSSATTPNVPLLYVNVATKETVPLTLRGNIAYALSFDANASGDALYGVVIGTNGNKTTTSLFKWNTKTKSASTFLPISDEDGDSFTYLTGSVLYTSIGKNQVHGYNLGTKRDFTYKRSASLPLKLAQNSTRLVVLNRDGSISWYNPTLSGVLADWYLTTDGQWFEF